MAGISEGDALTLLRTLWSLTKGLDDPQLRAFIAEKAANHVRAQWSNGLEQCGAATAFNRFGHCRFEELLNNAQIAEIETYLDQCSVQDDEESDASIRDRPCYHLNELPAHVALANHLERDVLCAPYLLDLARHREVLRVVSDFLGATPTVSSLMVWHSFPPADRIAAQAQIFHRDRGDFRFCKLFVYLSDVDAKNGPHVYLPGSHRLDTLMALFRTRNFDPTQVTEFFRGNGRRLNDVLERHFSEDVVEFCGPRGSSFLVNTYGFHKGKMPEQGRRVLFQVTYTVLPLRSITDQFSIQSINGKARWSEVPTQQAPSETDRYMFRLYLDSD